jgi:TonB family protein
MLLPAPNRSSLPFVASLTLQCSLVLLLAVPWTVQTLQKNGSLQMLTMPNLSPRKPAEPDNQTRKPDAIRNSLPASLRRIRPFQFLLARRVDETPDLPAALDLRIDAGMSNAQGEPAALGDVLGHVGPGATVQPEARGVAADGHDQPVMVGGRVQAAKLLHQVQPLYPALARQARVQGVVQLEAIIETDGTIRQLRVLSGHPLLIPSAVEAVQQWVYRPTILNEKAVEVRTTIEVRFSIS